MTHTHNHDINIPQTVADAIANQPVIDMHTHLYPPSFGTPARSASADFDPKGLMLWGIDELLTYHYLIAELFRTVSPDQLTPDRFYALSKEDQADLIWKNLFIERSPISESCRGVLTTLNALGLDTHDRNLEAFRTYFEELEPNDYINTVMQHANVSSITMTNNVFDPNEHQRWLNNPDIASDSRFTGVLRFDNLLCDWTSAAKQLAEWGYNASDIIDTATIAAVRKFLDDWLDRTNSIYAAVSLPPDFRYPAGEHSQQWQNGNAILTQAVLPTLKQRNLPFAMMIGSKRAVNPALKDAGDMGFPSHVPSITRLLLDHPDNRFFITLLSRENQHELAVAARKFGNLMPFGCWWFLNNPSLIEQITRLRIELLGTTFIPQHSDARVLDQLIYKWSHSRSILTNILTEKYSDLAATGWNVTESEIKRDIADLFANNFTNFCKP